MSKLHRYRFNSETLNYEEVKESARSKVLKWVSVFVVSFGLFLLYVFVYQGVFEGRSLRMSYLLRTNSSLYSKLDVMEEKYNQYNTILEELQMRDNTVYRPIFGLDSISADVRKAGYGGIDRYSYLELYDSSQKLASLSAKLDILSKKTYIQVKSLDDIDILAKRSEEMALCIPSIPPVTTNKEKIRISSPFGVRTDPFLKKPKFHHGIDLSAKNQGEPIYATGDGVVTKVSYDFRGYGNYVIIDHGFGYKTRYAHLRAALVNEGQHVKKGEHIAELGNTGRSKGPHLHYEVIYKNKTVNPYNYFNMDISPEEYAKMVKPLKSVR